MIEIIPSILTNNQEELADLLEKSQDAERISIDIIDGVYADNKTIDPLMLADYEISPKLDFQLMVKEPVFWIDKCIKSGADRIIGHIEQMSDQTTFVERVLESGIHVGLGLNLNTLTTVINPRLLPSLDVILVMSVAAGFGGQKFNDSSLAVVKKLNETRKSDNLNFKIHLDGGINKDNIQSVVKAGADEVSIGRSIFEGNLVDNIKKLEEIVKKD